MAKVMPTSKFLEDVPEEYVFRNHDGTMLRNMCELEKALGTMSDDTFAYHSSGSKNDFSNWVKDIIGDDKLAAELQKASLSRTQSLRAVSRRVAFLSKLR